MSVGDHPPLTQANKGAAMVDRNSASGRAMTGRARVAALNRSFREAIAQDRESLCGDLPKRKKPKLEAGNHPPGYSGGSLPWLHRAILFSQKLVSWSFSRVWSAH